MTHEVELNVISLGNEPAEVLGFKTKAQIETALILLIAEVFLMKPFLINKAIKGNKNSNDAKSNHFISYLRS